ncbi:MAG: hypothetical protein A2017_08830 [Lentisphaerae bacterium GWF2_44_16]|nr:MAG: hypothetical protein A2017_08830 [Lentisphaerae bacterium GWF2_44_16]
MGEMTVKEVREYLKSNQTIIFPYGVVEQHGYHLPLSMDIHNAEILAYKMAEKLDCIVAPCLNYCFSGGQLPGTINVKPNNFSNMVCDIMEALVNQGFLNIMVVPGHGGSESLLHLKESLRILKWMNPAMHKAMIIFIRRGDYSKRSMESLHAKDYHAGETETSLMLAYRPELVRMDEMEMDEPAIAEMMREDPDAYQLRTSFTGLKQEIANTAQRPEIKVGAMGHPERAKAETGIANTEDAIAGMIPVLKKALATAEEARKTGKMLDVPDNEKLKMLKL